MPQETWISSAAFADVEQISAQAARAALRGAARGKPWRGRHLKVRLANGPGGKRGLTYEVLVTTAPRADDAPTGSRRTTLDPRTTARLGAVDDLAGLPAYTADRGAAATRAATSAGVSRRTVYRWLRRYEAVGVRGLAQARPANAGSPRIHVSRAFDAAFREAGHPDDLLADLARELHKSLRGLWASRAEQAGAAEIRRLASVVLFELCRARGLRLPAEACQVSRRTVERFAAYRVINQRRDDRKAFDDAKPRIRRDWTGLLPMERVVADVKHLDIIVRRPDGTTAWPKIIAFLDAGTGRVQVCPVLLEPGEGVRQEHVIEAFLSMVSTSGWGFPQGLYLDNGSEFAALAKMDAALQMLGETSARTLIFARPYNASAKPIESLFARLDRQVFCLLPGYAGPNRMAAKTQTVGKPPQPYPGSWENFCETIEGLVRAHNHRPVGGARGGKSPEQWLAAKVTDGWRAIHVDPHVLDAAFSEPDSRRVDRGVLKIAGQRYSHELLAALPARTVVDLALPWRRNAPPLARLGGAWVYLERETLYPARWIEGARESASRQQRQARHVAALARDVEPTDPVALKIRWGQRQPDTALAAPRLPLDLGERAEQQAKAIRAEKAKPAPVSPAELRRQREMAITERLERARRRGDLGAAE